MTLPAPPPLEDHRHRLRLRIADWSGWALAYVYHRRDGALLDKYLTHDQAREMAQAIARVSLNDDPG